ncbi:MAG: serine/threonine protein kinase, partial [Planctomycetes bacterium]|nr:serine/threonine protein kinase [Planctomycetota bacterium]
MRSLAGYQTEALRFERLLGCGGMGDVYIGLQRRLHRLVAIKVVAAHLASDQRTRSRFEREAQVMSRLQHPNVVSCYDYGPIAGPDGDELFVLVLEYVDGDHLGTLTANERPVREVLEWLRQAALGLHAAHELGIVHRDVKPENILVVKGGIAKIADFGLARAVDVVSVTQTGAVVGTPAYMAPETCLRGEMTPRSDIYGLGCTLYHALTGEVPYAGSNAMVVIEQHVGSPPPRLADRRPDLAELDPLLRRCLAKDPAERWQDARDVVLALRGIAEHRSAGRSGSWPGLHGLTGPTGSDLGAGSRRLHVAWTIVAVIVGLTVWLMRPMTAEPMSAGNPRPVVVLMDSPLPGRVYDPLTLAAGGTNADDVSDALRDLPVLTYKENTSPMWHREEQVREQNPDLVVSHLSCLLDQRLAQGDRSLDDHLFDIAQSRLTGFFGYLATSNPRTRFLIYSRGRHWPTSEAEATWARDVAARFPRLNGRLFT